MVTHVIMVEIAERATATVRTWGNQGSTVSNAEEVTVTPAGSSPGGLHR